MAVEIFKDGQSMLIDGDVKGYIAQGWSLDDPNAPLPQGVTIINQKEPGEPPYLPINEAA